MSDGRQRDGSTVLPPYELLRNSLKVFRQSERIAAERVGGRPRLEHHGQDPGPVGGTCLRTRLVGGLDPLHLEGTIRCPDDARDLDRHGAFPDMPERVRRAGIVVEEDGAALRREVVSRQPVLAHQHWIERHRPEADDEAAEEPCDLRIGG